MKEFLHEVNEVFYLFNEKPGEGFIPKMGTSKIDLILSLNAALEAAKRLPDGILKNG